MKKILLRYYPKDNLGDDLFVKVTTERYKNTFSLVAKKHSIFIRNATNIKTYGNFFICMFVRAIEITTKTNNLWLKLLKHNHDVMLYTGGSIFIDNDNMNHWKLEHDFYKNLQIPYYILGSNFGPTRSIAFTNLVGEIFSRAEDVCFRDKASYLIFKNLKTTRVSSDIVFTLNTSKYNNHNEKVAIFSVINCADRFDKIKAQKYDNGIISMAKQLIDKDYKVVLMSFCKFEGDETAIERILSKIDRDTANKIDTYYYKGDIDDALELITKCEIVVASRFHATILGLLFGKKVLPIAYSNKTTNILNDMKFNGPIIDINNIDEFNSAKFDFDNLQINNVSEQIKLAELQFQELDKVLTKQAK